MAEPFPPVVGDGFLGVGSEAGEYHVATYQRASASLTRVAVDDHNILGFLYNRVKTSLAITFKEFMHLLACLKKDVEGWGVMVFPGEGDHT